MIMQRIWAGVAAMLAVVAVFTTLALRQAPVTQTATGTATATHATTSSSTVATNSGNPTSAVPAAVTRSS
jgi:hypothetical protein